MNTSYKYIILFCIFFITSPSKAMELNQEVTISLYHFQELEHILIKNQPLANAIPHIKELQQEPTWKKILENKSACEKVLTFMSNLELSRAPKEVAAIFIGTPGMIDWAKEYIKDKPEAVTNLNNILVDTGSWFDVAWDNQATNIADTIIQVTGNPDAINNYGETALINAAQNNHYAVMTVLLSAGANPNIQNKNGETALTIVKKILGSIDSYKKIAVVLGVTEKIYNSQNTQ